MILPLNLIEDRCILKEMVLSYLGTDTGWFKDSNSVIRRRCLPALVLIVSS